MLKIDAEIQNIRFIVSFSVAERSPSAGAGFIGDPLHGVVRRQPDNLSLAWVRITLGQD